MKDSREDSLSYLYSAKIDKRWESSRRLRFNLTRCSPFPLIIGPGNGMGKEPGT